MEFLTSEWSKKKYANILDKRVVFYAFGTKCLWLFSVDIVLLSETVQELESEQEEADTRMPLLGAITLVPFIERAKSVH